MKLLQANFARRSEGPPSCAANRSQRRSHASVSKQPGFCPNCRSPRSSPTTRPIPLSAVSTPPSDVDLAEPLPFKENGEKFVWEKSWYPVVPVDTVDPTKPYPFFLLGRELVLWKDLKSEWHAFEDRCPHRGAPFSCGAVSDKGRLVCGYHGWEFDGEGVCVRSPQSADPDAPLQSRRATATRFPVKEAQGLLWVWPESAPEAWIESSMSQPFTVEECEPGVEGWVGGGWSVVDTPASYVTSVENSFDPTHSLYVHRGLLGQPDEASPMKMNLGDMNVQGFSVQHGNYKKKEEGLDCERIFTAPCSNTTRYSYANGMEFTSQLYFVPTKPGYCRYLVSFVFKLPETLKRLASPLGFVRKITPPSFATALSHLGMYKLNDQDVRILSGQDKVIHGRLGEWRKQYYTPTRADLGVVAFRKWLESFGGGDLPWDAGAPEYKPLSQEELYDRWHRHTKNCVHCRRAFKNVRSMQSGLNFASFGFLVASAGIGVFGTGNLRVSGAFGALLGSVLSVLGVNALEDLAFKFLSSVPRNGLPGEPDLYD